MQRIKAGDAIPEEEPPTKMLRLRYFTPREEANLLGFPAWFKFPESVSTHSQYKLLGNSVSIAVVTEVARFLLRK
jgi:tRNA (cytosine38-C5)-methyltransferase